MLLFRQHIAPSAIEGIGLFADEHIAIGRVMWVYDSRVDRILPRDIVNELPQPARDFLSKYATLRPFGWCLDGDNGRFVNHSGAPNMVFDALCRCVAARAIKSGEEITFNYAALSEVPSVGGADGRLSFVPGIDA